MAARDIIFVAIVLFGCGLSYFVTHFAVNEIVDQMLVHSGINSSTDAVTALQDTATLTGRADYVSLGAFIGLILMVIISSWVIPGQPVFMFMYIVVIVISVPISVLLSNVWETFTQSAQFGTTISSFPITNHLLLNLPIYIVVLGLLGMTIMFAKPKEQETIQMGGI